MTFDVAIVGLGAMGSAAAWQLAARGARVLGIDRFGPPHASGSSHGQSRIIREAYFEHPQYVPIVQRAYELWSTLERASGQRLLEPTGGLMIGRPESTVVAGALLSARTHGLRHELIDGAETTRRFPALRPREDMVAVWEPRAGVLAPERAIGAMLQLSREHGATIETGQPVVGWHAEGGAVTVSTAASRYTAATVVLSAGAWTTSLLPELALPLAVERTVLHWFDPRAHAERFEYGRLPIYILEDAPGTAFYGFPMTEAGVKIARHHQGRPAMPDALDRVVRDDEVERMRPLLREFLPDLDGRWRSSEVCMYTNTPDEDFIVDWHPRHPRVLVVSACSGHGFKFASAIGEIVADLVVARRSRFDLTPFRIDRFDTSSGSHPGRAG